MKKYFKKSLALLLAFMMVFSYMVYVEPVEAEARATIDTYRKADKYGTPVWDGSNTYYSKWNSGSSYTTFRWPKHIYLDISETLESAGYYYTVEWDYGNGTDYRIVNNGFIFGGWGLQDTSGWPTNYYTMTNMFNNYDMDASTHGTQDGIDGGSSTDFDLKVGGDNWDGAQVIIWRNPSGDDAAQHQYVFMKGTPKATGYGLYTTSGAKPSSFGGWQYWSNGWKNASDKYTASNDSSNWTTDCYEGTWKEVRFEITVYDKSDLNYAKQKSDSVYNQNAAYASYITAGLDNYVEQHNATATLLTTREVTQAGLSTQMVNLSNAANGLRFAASNSALLTAISNAQAKMAETGYATKYTQASRDALSAALNNATASTYDDGVTTYAIDFSDNSTWNAGAMADADQTAINNLAAALNSAVAGLKNVYTVSFNFIDGTVNTTNYDDGATVVVPANSTKIPDAAYHYSYAWDRTVAGTATENATYTEVETAEAHSWSDWTVTAPSTCSAEGIRQRSCTVCGYIETDSVEKIAHIQATREDNRVEATCGADGSYDFVTYCSVCGYVISSEAKTIPATGEHVYSTEKERVPATCTVDGYVIMECKCGATDETILDAPGHSPAGAVQENRKEPGCTVPGSYDDVVYCTVCTEELSRTTQTIPVVDHVEAEAVTENDVPATCTADGSYDEVVYCKNCGGELSRTTHTAPMKDHTPAASVEENRIESTCLAQGSYDSVIKCKDCGFEIARTPITLPIGDHKGAEAVREKEITATCTSEGYYESVVYCSVCDVELSRDEVTVPMTEHAYVDHEAQFPTCKDGGWYAYQTCENCDYSTYEYIEATGEHIYATEQERVDNTCTADGYVIMACGCGTTQKTTLTAPGHSPKAAVKENNVSATCLVNGSYDEVVYCNTCGEELSRESKVNIAPGHSPKAAVMENEVIGDCLTQGSHDMVVYCGTCGEELSRESVITSVTGHTPSTSVTENEVEATCSAEGSYDKVVYCSVCVEELSRETVTVPKKSHTPGDVVVENEVEATCSVSSAYDNVVYCSECDTELSRNTVTGTTIDHTKGKAVKENEVEAKCTTPGSYENAFYCTQCGTELDRVTVTTGVKGHNIVSDKAVEPTCEKTGKTLGSHCSVCNEVIVAQLTVPAPGHTVAVRLAVAPTCTNTGLTEGSYCSVCKKELVLQEEIPANGHPDEDGDGICDLDGRDVTDMTPDEEYGVTVTPDADGDGYPDKDECPDCGRVHINFFSEIVCLIIRLLTMLGFTVK